MKGNDHIKNVDKDFCGESRADIVRYRMVGEHCKRFINSVEQDNAVKKARFCEAKH